MNKSVLFIKEVIAIFKERPLKEIIFGKKVALHADVETSMRKILDDEEMYSVHSCRKGEWKKLDIAHKGAGTVYLLRDIYDDSKSRIVLWSDTKIMPGPDLYLYLSTNENPKKDGLGDILDLGLIKGTKGGQMYMIERSIQDLEMYASVVIHCKQFNVLFTYAILS